MMVNESKKYLNIGLEPKYRLIDYYNKHCIQLVKPSRKYKVQYNDNWCATFTSVIAHKCGLTSSDFPFECGVQEQVKIAKEKGIFYTDIDLVKRNDLIIYDWESNNWADHVGFVIAVSEGTIKVIEGNIKNTVGYRTLPIKSKSIKGFIRVGVEPVKLTEDEEYERIADLARDTVNGKYGNGLERKLALGVDYEKVQKHINVFYT